MRDHRKFVALILLAFFLSFEVPTEADFLVFRSADGTQNWTRCDQEGLGSKARVNGFFEGKDLIGAGTDEGIFFSRDLGKSWVRSKAFPADGRVISLTTQGSHWFAGTEGAGLFRSKDSGGSWERVGKNIETRSIRSLFTHAGTIYLGTDREGVYRSADGGNTWVADTNGLPEHAQVHQFAVCRGQLFAALYSQGLYRRTAEGKWEKVGSVTPLALAVSGDALIAGHNPGGIFASLDLGRNWRAWDIPLASDEFVLGGPPSPGREAPIWAMAGTSERILAGAGPAVMSSTDQGKTWKRITIGEHANAPAVAFLATDNLWLAALHVKE